MSNLSSAVIPRLDRCAVGPGEVGIHLVPGSESKTPTRRRTLRSFQSGSTSRAECENARLHQFGVDGDDCFSSGEGISGIGEMTPQLVPEYTLNQALVAVGAFPRVLSTRDDLVGEVGFCGEDACE